TGAGCADPVAAGGAVDGPVPGHAGEAVFEPLLLGGPRTEPVLLPEEVPLRAGHGAGPHRARPDQGLGEPAEDRAADEGAREEGRRDGSTDRAGPAGSDGRRSVRPDAAVVPMRRAAAFVCFAAAVSVLASC